MMYRNKNSSIPVPSVGTVVTETHRYETGTTIIPFPTIDEADRDKVQISWRCVGQTVLLDGAMIGTMVVTWQCEAVEWVGG